MIKLGTAAQNIIGSLAEEAKRLGHVEPIVSHVPPMEECVKCETRKGTVLGNDGRLYCPGCAKNPQIKEKNGYL